MPSWINSRARPAEEPQPRPNTSLPDTPPAPPKAAGAALPLDEQSTLSREELTRQLLSELRQVQAAFTSGGELVNVEFDLLQAELTKRKPAPGILHKAVDIIRHKVTERGEITLSNVGRAQLTRVDELIAQLPTEHDH